MRMGADGTAFLKPEEDGGLPFPDMGGSEVPGETPADFYDEVVEVRLQN